jgi:hypothetical protein
LNNVLNSILRPNTGPSLPTSIAIDELVNKFSLFFIEKINKIRRDIGDHNYQNQDDAYPGVKMTNFDPVSEEEIIKIIAEGKSATCTLDPIPTTLLKNVLPVTAKLICQIVNLSLSEGRLPDELKKAIIKPTLKKLILDAELLCNYRPISNLSFISKLIEKVVTIQILKRVYEQPTEHMAIGL